MNTSIATPNVEASEKSALRSQKWYITTAMVSFPGVASMRGMLKLRIVWANTQTQPPIKGGSKSGKVILKRVVKRVAPLVRAASSNSL